MLSFGDGMFVVSDKKLMSKWQFRAGYISFIF